MKRKRFSEEQFIDDPEAVQCGGEASGSVPPARDQRDDTVQWAGPLQRHGSMDAKRPRALEEENRKLKKLLAEAHLDMAALKDIASGKF